jgi:hypothetical protein
MIENGSLQFRRSPPTLAHPARERSMHNSGSSDMSSGAASRITGRGAGENEGGDAGASGQETQVRRERDVGTEFARLTLVLDQEYNSLVPADSRGAVVCVCFMMLLYSLSNSLANSLSTSLSTCLSTCLSICLIFVGLCGLSMCTYRDVVGVI